MRRSAGSFGLLLVAAAIVGAPPAHSSPAGDVPQIVATNTRDARARVSVSGGRFEQDGVTGIVSVVNRAGTVYASFAPEAYVNGAKKPVIAVIDASATVLNAVVVDGLRAGSALTTVVADRGAGDDCAGKGVSNALAGALQGALSGALAQRLSLDASTVVTHAAVDGSAGSWRGPVDGCVTGLRKIAS